MIGNLIYACWVQTTQDSTRRSASQSFNFLWNWMSKKSKTWTMSLITPLHQFWTRWILMRTRLRAVRKKLLQRMLNLEIRSLAKRQMNSGLLRTGHKNSETATEVQTIFQTMKYHRILIWETSADMTLPEVLGIRVHVVPATQTVLFRPLKAEWRWSTRMSTSKCLTYRSNLSWLVTTWLRVAVVVGLSSMDTLLSKEVFQLNSARLTVPKRRVSNAPTSPSANHIQNSLKVTMLMVITMIQQRFKLERKSYITDLWQQSSRQMMTSKFTSQASWFKARERLRKTILPTMLKFLRAM